MVGGDMNNEQILKKAIEKAEKNGYENDYPKDAYHIPELWYPAIIFSHDFAKAFWGEELTCLFCGKKC